MISWGISANSHDAALAVFVDDHLTFASHSERFSGLKNDSDLNKALLDYASYHWGSPDRIYWYERPFLKTLRQLVAGQGWQNQNNNIDIYMARYGIDVPINYTGHHHSHAAAGYYTSKFEEAAVLVIDAIGEFETITMWKGSGSKLKKVHAEHYPTSLGLWYSAMTQRIGLKPNEEEYILMGMAAYGNPNKFYQKIRNDFLYSGDDYSIAFTKNLHKGCLDWAPEITKEDYFDIAAAVQLIYEECFLRLLKDTSSRINSDNLVFMGGCALNCKANDLAFRYFKNVWIMPNPGDAGSAIGAVLAQKKWRLDFDPFIGYDMGYRSTNEQIVEHLVEQQICGVARGRAEFGPRALGNRSLLADPRGQDIKDCVNAIKQRQAFRPFAPIILEELAMEYFDMPTERSPYMQFTAKCKQPELFPAIVHADGTSRVQTVGTGKEDCPKIRQLLELWYARTGCPMLLNTSLNIKGKPMVNNHADSKNFEQKYGVKVFN
jgi:carbamoyltransferase